MIHIADLPYLESLPTIEDILGGDLGVEVTSYASATGDSSYTLADANTRARVLRNGIGIAIGWGKAIAIGDDPTAVVAVAGEGDLVFGRTKNRSGKRGASARGFVIAIDFPDR